MILFYAAIIGVLLLAVLAIMLFLVYRETAEDLPCKKEHHRSLSHGQKRV
jgi:hypothetical protein